VLLPMRDRRLETFGRAMIDLHCDWDAHEWRGRPEESHDTVVKRAKKDFVRNVKNTYRVLFSRGLKGCHVYFVDEGTRRFFESRMEHRAGHHTMSSDPKRT
jgi:DUF2075 family protein